MSAKQRHGKYCNRFLQISSHIHPENDNCSVYNYVDSAHTHKPKLHIEFLTQKSMEKYFQNYFTSRQMVWQELVIGLSHKAFYAYTKALSLPNKFKMKFRV